MSSWRIGLSRRCDNRVNPARRALSHDIPRRYELFLAFAALTMALHGGGKMNIGLKEFVFPPWSNLSL
jgi:hypothetical protein